MPTNPDDPKEKEEPLEPNLAALTGAQIGNPPIVTEEETEGEKEEAAPPEDEQRAERPPAE